MGITGYKITRNSFKGIVTADTENRIVFLKYTRNDKYDRTWVKSRIEHFLKRKYPEHIIFTLESDTFSEEDVMTMTNEEFNDFADKIEADFEALKQQNAGVHLNATAALNTVQNAITALDNAQQSVINAQTQIKQAISSIAGGITDDTGTVGSGSDA